MTTKRPTPDATAPAPEGAGAVPAKAARKAARLAAERAAERAAAVQPAGGAGVARHGGAVARRTPIERCVGEELKRHFDLLGDEPPRDLYKLVMRQAESSLLLTVMDECRGNQSKAATWLGISRGTLRGRLAEIRTR